jgi:amino acid transporter
MSTSTAPRADAPPSGGVFSRSASGLIRVAGSWDVFIFNVGLVSVGIAIAFNQYYGPSLYPGAEPAISTLLAALGMCFAAATFYFWSTIFPRSGGVYVILSRTTHSSLAFLFSLLETVILLYYGAPAASLLVQVGLGSFFATVGSIGGNDTLVGWAGDVTGARGTFWIGTGVLLLAGLLLATGTRRYFTVQRVVFVVAVVATAVTLLVMLFGSRSSFQSNLTDLTGLKYDDVVSTAKDNGFVSSSGIDWGETFKFLVWPLLPLLGAIQSIGIGGEIKKVRTAQLFGMLGAVIATGLLIALFAVLSNKAFGQTFQGAVAFNSLSGIADGSTEGSIGAAPYFTTLAGILANNSFLAVIIMAAFVAWFWFWIPAEIAYTTRSMIAWSFDRLVPSQMGYVSRRFHTPVVAIGIGTAGSIVFMWLIAFHGIALLTLIEALLVIWGSAMAVAIVFPWVGKRFYNASPAQAYRFAGLPLMSVTGAITTAFFAVAFVLLWTDDNAAGALFDKAHRTELWIIVGTLVAGAAWYVGNKLYRRSQGVDIELAFRQIPIE